MLKYKYTKKQIISVTILSIALTSIILFLTLLQYTTQLNSITASIILTDMLTVVYTILTLKYAFKSIKPEKEAKLIIENNNNLIQESLKNKEQEIKNINTLNKRIEKIANEAMDNLQRANEIKLKRDKLMLKLNKTAYKQKEKSPQIKQAIEQLVLNKNELIKQEDKIEENIKSLYSRISVNICKRDTLISKLRENITNLLVEKEQREDLRKQIYCNINIEEQIEKCS